MRVKERVGSGAGKPQGAVLLVVFPPRKAPQQTTMTTPSKIIGRLAPSPTGFLHLGNAWAFFLSWLGTRSRAGELILRMEDIDPLRSRPEYATAIMRDLHWLGLDWDGEAIFQSHRLAAYERAIAEFTAKDLVYPCYCTRKELRELASAPHMASLGAQQRAQGGGVNGVGDLGAPYSGVCRTLSQADRARLEAQGRRPCLRLLYPPLDAGITDLVQGEYIFKDGDSGGDFALRRSDGVFAYQLAVCVDDAAMGINQVVRGCDILASTPRQMYLLGILGGDIPQYAHVSLLLDHQGERLAKRHNSLRLETLRANGVAPEQIIGWLAWLAGLQDSARPARPSEFLAGFAFNRLPRENILLDGEILPAFIA